jgi:hypothetical protein
VLIAYTVTGGLISDPYPILPVMRPPACEVAVGAAVGDGAEIAAVAVAVGVGVDTAVVGGICALMT